MSTPPASPTSCGSAPPCRGQSRWPGEAGSTGFLGLGARLLAGVTGLAALPVHAVLPTVPSHSAAEAAPAVGAGGLLQAGFGMVVVLGLIFLCAWLARRFGLQRFNGGNAVKVVSSSNIGQRERVVVVEVSGTWLVLGVTPNQINTLHTLPAQAVPQAPAAANAAAQKPIDLFAQKLRESITGKTRPAP